MLNETVLWNCCASLLYHTHRNLLTTPPPSQKKRELSKIRQIIIRRGSNFTISLFKFLYITWSHNSGGGSSSMWIKLLYVNLRNFCCAKSGVGMGRPPAPSPRCFLSYPGTFHVFNHAKFQRPFIFCCVVGSSSGAIPKQKMWNVLF